jgi:hypothetical protein
MFRVLTLKEDINRLSSKLLESGALFFEDLSLPIPRFVPPELGFLRTVSWLYALYIETAKVNMDFIIERFPAYGLDTDGKHSTHYALIQKMRTYSQHNLDLTQPRNQRIQEDCEQWFSDQCGTPVPCDDHHWNNCLINILVDAVSFGKTLLRCIRNIEGDDSKDRILQEWDSRRKRSHSPHEFDTLIEIVAADMGREHIDAVRLRKRFYDRWIKELELLDEGYDFGVEAQKLIEHALLSEIVPVLPITGKDIITTLGITPGAEVGRVLDQARTLYEESPCSGTQLLEKLRETLTQGDLQ